MMDGVGDGGPNSDNSNLAHALDSHQVNLAVRLFDEDGLDVVHVGMHRHMVLGNVRVHHAAEVVVDQRLFVEGHADPPDHAPHNLTGGGFRTTTRVTRTIPSCSSTFTSAKIAEWVLRACLVS